MAFPTPSEVNPVTLPFPHPDAYEGEPREFARALMQRKDEIEREIDTLKAVLTTHNANGSTSLFDPEGYPRADIDVYAIRHARAALARLYNDRQEVVNRLAPALEAAFNSPAPTSSDTPFAVPPATPINGLKANGHVETSGPRSINPSSDPTPSAADQANWPERPVARVNNVATASPAEEAGMKAGDMIYAFGTVKADGLGSLAAIGALVGRSEGVSLSLLVERQNETGIQRISLSLTPRTGWGGRGSLGCHILPT